MPEGTISSRATVSVPEWPSRLVPDRSLPISLGRQLYLGLYEAITRGELPYGATLPPSRSLAAHLGVARNTVVAAYAQLGDEGLVSSAGRRSTVVVHDALNAGMTAPSASGTSWPLSARAGILATRVAMHRALAPGEPDPKLFPAAHWQRAMARAARLPRTELGYRSDVPRRLQGAIARHLAVYRSLVVDPARIVVTSGTRQSLLLAAAMYADGGDSAWVEAPGYGGAVDAFRTLGLSVRACAVDEAGANPLAGHPPPRLAYLTPCFQYPLGMPLSASRRDAFLALSCEHGTVLFEDDYDSEFRDDTQPRPALAASGAASTGRARVLHAGTFSKLIFPAARVAWLVVPASHAERARRVLRALGGGHGTLMQAAVAEVLDAGVLARHLERARQVYAQRRRVLLERVADSSLLGLAGGGGLCAVLEPERPVPLVAFERTLDEQGLGAVPLERLDWSAPLPRECRRIVLGLGNVDSLSLPGELARLERAVELAWDSTEVR